MVNRIAIGVMGAVMMLVPLANAQDPNQKPSPVKESKAGSQAKTSGMSADMREAIAWERAKDRAAARQARIEARHPGNHNESERAADRVMDDKTAGRKVKDTQAPGAKRDQ